MWLALCLQLAWCRQVLGHLQEQVRVPYIYVPGIWWVNPCCVDLFSPPPPQYIYICIYMYAFSRQWNGARAWSISPFILHSECHGNYVVDLILPEYSGFSTSRDKIPIYWLSRSGSCHPSNNNWQSFNIAFSKLVVKPIRYSVLPILCMQTMSTGNLY